MIRRFYVGLRSTTGKLCARELSRRPHLHGDSSRLSSPPGSLSWQPVAGVSNTDPKAAPRDKYLFEELKSRLQRWPARFLLMMTIGDADDDPTKPGREREPGSSWVRLSSSRWPRIRGRMANASVSIPAVFSTASKSPDI